MGGRQKKMHNKLSPTSVGVVASLVSCGGCACNNNDDWVIIHCHSVVSSYATTDMTNVPRQAVDPVPSTCLVVIITGKRIEEWGRGVVDEIGENK